MVVLRRVAGREPVASDRVLTTLRILHVLSACVWVGGTIALVFVGVPAIRRLEGEARASHAGLWSDATAVAPWEWRKAKAVPAGVP